MHPARPPRSSRPVRRPPRQAQVGRWYRAVLRLVFLLFCACALAAESVTVDLDAPKEVAPLLRQYVRLLRMEAGSIPTDGPDRVALTRRTRAEVEELLATEGYFSPKVRIDRSDPEHWRLVVEPGSRAMIATVSIDFVGSIDAEAAHREALSSGWALPVGQPFRQADWEEAKKVLLDALRNERYAAAKFVTTEADVDPESAAVNLKIVVDSGPVFHLGAVAVSGLRDLPPDFVARHSMLKEGDVYKRGDLLAFQESLQSAPQLSVAVVSIDPDPQQAEAVPVQVDVKEAAPQRLGFGLGMSSNTGYRGETSYSHLNLFGLGWELTTGLRLEQRRQSLYADVFLPPDHGRHRDSVGVGLERSDLEKLKIYTQAVGVTRSTKRGAIETQLATRVQHESMQPENADSSSYSTLTLNWSWVDRAVDNVLDPRQGHVLEVQLGGGVGLSQEAHSFTRAYGRYQQYFSFGKRNVLTLRGEAGTTFAQTRDGIPQDFLFRAGGTQSVRGFAYRSLGVTEGTATVGGRYMATGSAEFVRWIKPNAGVAVFVDSGDAADSRKSLSAHTGYGLGARWLSPAGPLAVDLAWGEGEKSPRLHFGVSVAF